MKITELANETGAEITQVDLRKLTDADSNKIYETFLRFHVIAVRDQELEAEDWLAFGSRFGKVRQHINKSRSHPDLPQLMLLDNQATKDAPAARYIESGIGWHSDASYDQFPAKATALYPVFLPSRGGDTLFNNMHTAYDSLPARLKAAVDERICLNNYGGRAKRNLALLDKSEHNRLNAAHHMVITHPETGLKALYLNLRTYIGIVGMSDTDADALVKELAPYVDKGRVDYRHLWRKGDAVIWDNRSVVHSATGDYPLHERRLLWRLTIDARASAEQVPEPALDKALLAPRPTAAPQPAFI